MNPSVSFEEFADFIEELRRRGFLIGIDQYIAARRLLESELAASRRAGGPQEFLTLLAPILCNTAGEQEAFYLEYLQWLERRSVRSVAPRNDGTLPGGNPLRRFLREKRFRTWRIAVVVLVLVLAIGGLALEQKMSSTYVQHSPGDPRKQGFPSATLKPQPKAWVNSDTSGQQNVPNRRSQLMIVEAKRRSAVMVADNEPTVPDTAHVDITPLAGRENARSVHSLYDDAAAYYRRNYLAIKAGVVALPLSLFALWWLWSGYRRRRLDRRLTSRIPNVATIPLDGPSDRLFDSIEFRRDLQALRRHRFSKTRDLDLAATVESTAQSGGWFSPIYSPRRVVPEYLVLIDRRGSSDQQARYFDRIVDEFVGEGAYVDRFYFNGDPRHCFGRDAASSQVTLAELASRYPEHRLLIFGDGDGLFNPLDGTPHRWLDLLGVWDLRVLMTPLGADEMKPRRNLLHNVGVLVLPADAEGIAALADVVGSDATPSPVWSDRSYPSLLLDNPEQWISKAPPSGVEIEDLRLQLLDYLGIDGYNWLAACAILPMMQWELTLHLGERLLDDSHFERVLPAIVRLPWFRHGAMPEWLRISLIGSLVDDREQQMRRVIDELLQGAPSRHGTIRLRMARQGKDEDASLVYDYVFLCFMSGIRPKPTSVPLPESLRRIIYRNDIFRFRLRPAPLVTLAVVCTLAAFILFPSLPVVPIRSITVTPASGVPGGTYHLHLNTHALPDLNLSTVELVSQERAPLRITDLRAVDSQLIATLTVPLDREEGLTRVSVRQGGKVIGTFPFTVRHDVRADSGVARTVAGVPLAFEPYGMLPGRHYDLKITPYDCQRIDVAGLQLQADVPGIALGRSYVDGCTMVVPVEIAEGARTGSVRLSLKRGNELVALLRVGIQDEFPEAFRVGPVTARAGTDDVKLLISSSDCRRQSLRNITTAGSSTPHITFDEIRSWGTGRDTCIAVGHLSISATAPAGTYQIFLQSNDGVRRWGIDFTVLPQGE